MYFKGFNECAKPGQKQSRATFQIWRKSISSRRFAQHPGRKRRSEDNLERLFQIGTTDTPLRSGIFYVELQTLFTELKRDALPSF